MNTRCVPRFQIFTFITLACFVVVGVAAAQESGIAPGSERPMFTRLPATLHQPRNGIEAASTPLQTWNGSFTYQGTTYHFNMVGTQPSTNTSATIPVEIIPIKIVITNRHGVKTTLLIRRTCCRTEKRSQTILSRPRFLLPFRLRPGA